MRQETPGRNAQREQVRKERKPGLTDSGLGQVFAPYGFFSAFSHGTPALKTAKRNLTIISQNNHFVNALA
jgi:hypothetical protein